MASSSSLPLSLPSSSLSRNWEHNVFPSFHGPDVRKGFLSHLRSKFRSKGIEPFIDNEIKRGESIGPELERAIRGSKIAIVLLSKNYASSSWCLDELEEIMKCRERRCQIVVAIFYEVEPTDVKKQTGDFGKAFEKTCQFRTKEKIETWRKALEGVATIAGYDSKNCVDEAAMIDDIAADISNKLNLTPSCDFERYIGMGAHKKKMKSLLRMDSNEVRMIGIWGPPGIGKTTIARFLFEKLSNSFQLKAKMEKIKECYPRPCAQLQLQNQMLSQMLDHKDMVIRHLGVAQERLKEKKVLLVLDDVDQVAQLEALAENTGWFGPGSRIIIITEDLRVLTTHGINDIYTVDLPSDDEALQIFCMSAFGHKYPKDGFRKLAWQIVCHAGNLPLGLKVMGSYFRNKSKEEWKNALPKLWSSLDGEIESVLKFSYDALDYDDKYLFLHIACLFVNKGTKRVKECLAKTFPYVSFGFNVLAEKSLISIESRQVHMHDLLAKLGREIVRKESKDPGQRQFLVDSEEISELLDDDGAGSGEVIGIKFNSNKRELNISEKAFEKMSNLQFLTIEGYSLHLPHGLSYLSSKLRLLHWDDFPMTCLLSNLNMKFLVELKMKRSKLEKLWEGIKRLPNLKWVNLSYSKNLKELPDFSTATNLQKLSLKGCSSLTSIGNATNFKYLYLSHCSSLLRLPSSIGNAINLKSLFLGGCSSLSQIPSSIGNAINLEHLKLQGCSSLVELPTSIGNAINLEYLDFSGCSSLVELPASIGNLHKLEYLRMYECSKLEVLPVNVNLKSLDYLELSGCSSLKRFPEISTNIRYLNLRRTAIKEVPSSIRSWSRLENFDMYKCKKLKKFPHALDSKELLSLPQLPESLSELDCSKLDNLHLSGCSSLKIFPEISTNIRELNLSGTAIEEVPSAIWSWSRLETLDMSYCQKLKKFAHVFDRITERDVKKFPPLGRLILSGCKNILSLPQLPHSLNQLDAINCESLERLDCSLRHSYEDIHFNFPNCFKLNKEARDLIIQKSAREVSVLPGKEIPTYFTYRANGGSLIVKLKEMTFPSYLTFKACILLVGKNAIEGVDQTMYVDCEIIDKQNSLHVRYSGGKGVLHRPLTEHLYIFEVAALVASNELFFKFSLGNRNLSRKISDEWVIKECGVHGNCEGEEEENEGYISDEEEEKENGEAVPSYNIYRTKWRQMHRLLLIPCASVIGNYETGCSKSKVIDHFIEMGFDEEKVIKAIDEHGEENMEQIANALFSSEFGINGDCETETKKRKKTKSLHVHGHEKNFRCREQWKL